MRHSVVFLDQFRGYVDPRVADWALMGNPWPTIFISIIYLVTVSWIGPWVMRSRVPINPIRLILLYNGFQIFFSLWLFIQSGRGGWFGQYNFICQPFHFSTDKTSMIMVNASWWFFISKFTEFMDTIFLILRKKNEQVSVLHVVHHGIMPFCAWCMANTTPVGHGTLTGLINPFVHFIMYIYYFIAALGPRYAKFIWWKKYLTTFQMIQFLITFGHACLLLVLTDCDYPVHSSYVVIFLSVLFFCLFINYFIQQSNQIKIK